MDSPSKMHVVLVVDDDELILSTLRGLFALETDYEVITQNDPRAALEEAGRRPIDVVISDFLMPQMNGVEFLRHLRKQQPEAVRILLTGFADKENAIRAINEVGLYQYVEKPWKNEDLLLLLRNAVNQKTLQQQLSEKVSALEQLVREHRDLTDRHRLLERELDMAARVQRSLLPSSLPAVDGFRFAWHYQPSTALGGDYYDFGTSRDSTVLLVSDVSGHGAQASLVSMLIKATFQDLVTRADGPVQLLEQMNAHLNRFLPMGMFAGATVIWFRAGSSKFQIINAGLPYPFILRARELRVDQIPLGGLPLGLFGESLPVGYECQERELDPNDVLLVATDGLGDIRGLDDEFFEKSGLPSALQNLTGKAGEAVIEQLLRQAAEFSNGRNYPDDISVVAVTKT
jgi:serine phosphatase RsbU (regulator of sigma subunit)